MSAVSVSESGVWPILADAVDVARRALVELEPAGVGAHLGVTAEDASAATHRFEATLPGYHGWQWAVVVAAAPGATYATVSESALLPGPDALVAPDFVPWDQRVRPGDLAPGDLLAPLPNDPRLVPGYVANGDPAVDEVARDIGLGRTKVLSLEGREEAAERWYAEFGPDTEMAKAAPSTCGLCGFYLPLAGAMRAAFGVCGNAMGADGRVVHVEYGCGAHSDTVVPTGGGSPLYEAYDDAAFDVITSEAAHKPASEAAQPPVTTKTEPSTTDADSSAGTLAPAAESDTVIDSVGTEVESTPGAAGDVAAEPSAVGEADAAVLVTAEVEAASTADVAGGVAVESTTATDSDAGTAVSIPGGSTAGAVSAGLPSDDVAEAGRVAAVDVAGGTAAQAGAARVGDSAAEQSVVGEFGAAVSVRAEGVRSPQGESSDEAVGGATALEVSPSSTDSVHTDQASSVQDSAAAEPDSSSASVSSDAAEQALSAQAAGDTDEPGTNRPESESSARS
ncbi:DUF3027 domain-containing protein [Nocardia sp. NPDC051463]|uniref:DUF3027 domain-containing protein n=1 Tax=Nocardia sp. NPDC051463 TaxID=3154845 RepID=UPI00344E4C13